MGKTYAVIVGAGASADTRAAASTSPHRRTDGGVSVGAYAGAQLLHAAVMGRMLDDVSREAAATGIRVAGVRVDAPGFDEQWGSAASTAGCGSNRLRSLSTIDPLLARVDDVAEIPRALRACSTVGGMG